ncbi:hypothetical protein V6N12_029102 [Hibiscus sabdariffa]|uniref:Putative plant transposon protein domain-containing protein n=1 Tax=Hibiscus sabdariffa TaxID=183260 RepID=A0ABR2F7S1_9ROSI
MVHGRRVAANAATINSILGLPNDAPSFYAMLGALEDEDYETIKDYLCLEGTAWNTTGRNPHSVSRTQLLPEAKLWNTFVKRNLLPTSHNQTVDRTRLVLIHTINTGYRINVGEILAKELAAACSNDKGILAFPCLISALCRRAAVPTSPIPTDEARSSNPAAASPAPAEPSPSVADSTIPSPAQHNQPSPAATPTDLPASRESTPDSPMGSTPEAPHPPPPAQSEEAVPLHILQLRNQLQRIEARQLLMQEEKKVFQQRLINFLCYQFPAAATYFNAQPEAPAAAHYPTNTQPHHLSTPLPRPATLKKFISHQTMRMTFLTGKRPEAIHQHPAQLKNQRQKHQPHTTQIQLMFQSYSQPLSQPSPQWRLITGERARPQSAAC